MKFKKCSLYSIIILILFLPFILNAQNNWKNKASGKIMMPLEKVLNPDGTVKTGIDGSFNAMGYKMTTGKSGRPVFKKKDASVAGFSNSILKNDPENPDDVYWDDRFGYFELNDFVYAIVIDGTDIYAGGDFYDAYGTEVSSLAKWDGFRWSDVGGGVSFDEGPPPENGKSNKSLGIGRNEPGSVYALVYSNGKLYVGGFFNYVGNGSNGGPANCIAVWDKSSNTWDHFGDGFYNDDDYPSVYSLVLKNGSLYAGGYFSRVYSNQYDDRILVNNIARWDFEDEDWYPLEDDGSIGLDAPVLTLYSGNNDDVIVGGYFYSTGGGGYRKNNNTGENLPPGSGNPYIKIWDNTQWQELSEDEIIHSPVSAITSDGAGNYYIGCISGYRAKNSPEKTNSKKLTSDDGPYCIYKWSYGSDPIPVEIPGSFNTMPVVSSLAFSNGKLFAGFGYKMGGGDASGFGQTNSGKNSINKFQPDFILRYDGTIWSKLGSGTNNYVFSLAASGSDLYVGGNFEGAGEKHSPYFAHWNDGTSNVNVSVSPTFLSFGDVAIGGNSEKTFKLTNIGTVPVTINGFSMVGADAAIYKRVSTPDSSAISIILNPGESYTIKLRFAPVSPGYKGAIYQMTYNAGASGGLLNVTLSGRGIAAKLSLSADNIPFGETKLNENNYRTLIITNSGVDILSISNLVFSGTDQSLFSIYNGNVQLKMNSKSGNSIQSISGISTNPVNINPGGSITITVAFRPNTEGAKTANLLIYHNDATETIPKVIPLTGTGVKTFARISVKTPYIFRPGTGICFLGAPVDTTIVITNLANNDYLYIKSVYFEKADGIYQILDNAPFFIAPSQSFNLRIRFNPLRRSTFVNFLHIINESQNMPDAVVQCSGTVYQPSLAIIPDTSLIDFGTTSREIVTVQKTVILQNFDPVRTINVTTKNLTGDSSSFRFIKGGSFVSLAPGQSDTIIIEFFPVTSGRKNATFNITTDDPLGINRYIMLTGVGGDAPVIFASIDPVDFGEVDRNVPIDTTVVISNIGNLLLNITKISIEGDDKNNFSITSGGNPVSLRNSESINLKIRFYGLTPVGLKNAELQILCNDPNNPTFKINLLALIRAKILVITPRIIFDTLEIGKYQDTVTIIKNEGNLSIRISKIYLDQSHNEDFSFTALPLPLDLSPGEEKSLKLKFYPKEEGVHYTRLIFNTNDALTPEIATVLRGTCIPLRNPSLSVIPDPLNFGMVEIDKNKDLAFTIKNLGGTGLKVDSMVITGDDARHFSILNANLPFNIASKDTQNVMVRFAPKNDTSRNCTAIIKIYSNDLSKPVYYLSVTGSILNQDYLTVYINDTTITDASFEIPVMVSDVTNRNILSFQFTLTFDQTKFNVFDEIIKTGSIPGSDWSILANNKTPGQITIGGFGSSYLSGKGVLLKIKLNVIGQTLQKVESVSSIIFNSKLVFSEFTFNSGKPSAFTKDGNLYINRQGSSAFLCGDADINGQVNAMDASMTLRHSVGLENLTTQGQKNADVDKNNTINVFDASLILRHAINLPMPSNVKTTCWAALAKNSTESTTAPALNIHPEQIVKDEKVNKLPLKFSGFSASDEVLGLSFDVTAANANSISISGLTSEYVSAINHVSGNLFKVAIINPAGINLKDISMIINYSLENNPAEISISYIMINDKKYHDINISKTNGLSVDSYDLVGAYPNPFNPSTNIVFQLPERSNLFMEIYDIKGSKVRTMMNDTKEKGRYEIVWDGKDEYGKIVSAGIYFCRMKAGSFLKTISLQLLK